MKPCEHCPNPIKEFYRTQCMYVQRLKRQGYTVDQIEARVLPPGFPLPCVRDAHIQELSDKNARDQYFAMFLIGGVTLFIIVLALLFT